MASKNALLPDSWDLRDRARMGKSGHMRAGGGGVGTVVASASMMKTLRAEEGDGDSKELCGRWGM